MDNHHHDKIVEAQTGFRKGYSIIDRIYTLSAIIDPILNAIKAMYRSVISCVRVNNDVTDFFECPFGVKQGCMLSPALFSLLVNELAVDMEAVGKHGLQLQPGLVELFLLLFVDDLALLSSTAIGLQNQQPFEYNVYGTLVHEL